MHVTRLEDARAYEAPGHVDTRSLRLQGQEASDAANFWVGLSLFLPGGGCERSASPIEKVYVVTEGEVTVVTDDGEAVLRPYDSCWLAASEARSIENRTNRPATMLVVLPSAPGAAADLRPRSR